LMLFVCDVVLENCGNIFLSGVSRGHWSFIPFHKPQESILGYSLSRDMSFHNLRRRRPQTSSRKQVLPQLRYNQRHLPCSLPKSLRCQWYHCWCVCCAEKKLVSAGSTLIEMWTLKPRYRDRTAYAESDRLCRRRLK
jgi:hypothetical protein